MILHNITTDQKDLIANVKANMKAQKLSHSDLDINDFQSLVMGFRSGCTDAIVNVHTEQGEQPYMDFTQSKFDLTDEVFFFLSDFYLKLGTQLRIASDSQGAWGFHVVGYLVACRLFDSSLTDYTLQTLPGISGHIPLRAKISVWFRPYRSAGLDLAVYDNGLQEVFAPDFNDKVSFAAATAKEIVESIEPTELCLDTSVSSSTLRQDHLFVAFFETLIAMSRFYNTDEYTINEHIENNSVAQTIGIGHLYQHAKQSAQQTMESLPDYIAEIMAWAIEELTDELERYAPDSHYFGALEGDASDFGFWEIQYEI